ncbi:hypothetical protein HN873_014294, partial [Arachis hypogaea]
YTERTEKSSSSREPLAVEVFFLSRAPRCIPSLSPSPRPLLLSSSSVFLCP